MKRGMCPVCERLVSVNTDGALRRHRNHDRAGGPRCRGSARFPVYYTVEAR